jgi:hypothetical protein
MNSWDTDYRAPLDLTNDAIEQQRQRSIVQSQIQIDRLTLSLTIRDNEVATLRRENDALRAQVARLTRKPIPRHSVALAWLALRLEALDRWAKAWWQ